MKPALAAVLITLLCITLSLAHAQSEGTDQALEQALGPLQTPSADFDIRLVTVGPGPNFWEVFGHNAIWVTHRASNVSVNYNFGIFDFYQKHFLLNFLRGRMSYQLAAIDAQVDLDQYLRAQRRVEVTQLNFTNEQAKRLVTELERHRQPENASYRYDYFVSNCSTKVRDALNDALSNAISDALRTGPSQPSYRSSLSDLAQSVPWMLLGANIALGKPVDLPLNPWSAAYLPESLLQSLKTASTANSPIAGLIGKSVVLSEGQAKSTSWLLWVCAAVTVLLGLFAIYRYSWARNFWCVASASIGLALVLVWLATDHWATAWNPALGAFSPILLLWPWSNPRSRNFLLVAVAIGMLFACVLSRQPAQLATMLVQLAALSILILHTDKGVRSNQRLGASAT